MLKYIRRNTFDFLTPIHICFGDRINTFLSDIHCKMARNWIDWITLKPRERNAEEKSKIFQKVKSTKVHNSKCIHNSQLSKNERWPEIGILETGMLQSAIVRGFGVAVSNICILQHRD